MNVTIKLENNSNMILEELNNRIPVALEVIGGVAEGYAAAKCPVKTGRLLGSIYHELIDSRTVCVGTDVKYAPYVEFGTHKRKAKPFLGPSIKDHVEQYKTILKNQLG